MTEQEKAERFVNAAPPLNRHERDKINALFPTYLFRRSKTREIWTTCCHRHEVLPTRKEQSEAERAVMDAPHQREPRNRWWAAPEENAICPYCGRPAIVKELGRTGGRDNLSRWQRGVVLRWYRGALWARAYYFDKHYSSGYTLTGDVNCKLVGVYRFEPGLAEGTRGDYWRSSFVSVQSQKGPLTKGKWNIHSPFYANAEYGAGYDVLGLDEIQKSPFRYCMAEEAEKKTYKFLEYLTACCFYPRQIEMLMKAKMTDVVFDLTERGVKHAAVINWDEENPAKVFGLDRQDLKTFLSTNRNIRTAELYKRLKGKVPLTECADWIAHGLAAQDTFRAAKKWNLPPEKLIRYLAGNVDSGACYGSIYTALRFWEDYLTAAEALAYSIHRENVLLPKNLGAAHDSATAKHCDQLERQRKADQAEQDRLAALAYQERKAELEKKYGFALDGYVIRVPAGKEEILAEGRELQHCVGGYADRHMGGSATILFMRKEKQPDKPWLTIEMHGNALVQIHGYRNEGCFTAKGRFAPDPREVYKDFLDTWLAWLAAGSKRDKNGKPKLPKKKKEANVA